MNPDQARAFVDHFWESRILPTLVDYIAIPNQSPMFDPEWQEHGHMDRAVSLVRTWVQRQEIQNSRLEVIEGDGRTPLVLLEVDGEGDGTVLLYGHLDKQPPMVGWDEGLGPWTPVLRDGKLYGRGGADDGYAIFAVVAAIKTLHAQGIAHPRLVVMIECCEESGSVDLPYYVDLLSDRIGTPGLVICLDSGCGNYEQLWSTTSLRGMVAGDLTVRVLTEGVHSGDATGIVPSSFRILRQLLNRLEDPATGRILPSWMHVKIPENRLAEARATAEALGEAVYNKFPWQDGMRPIDEDRVELLLNRTWRPTLAVTGQHGLPDLGQSGNVLRPRTSLKLSIRLPPTLPVGDIPARLKALLEDDPPYGAKVTFEAEKAAAGWDAPPLAPWLARSVNEASRTYFGREACAMGEGGSIPFMGMLGERYPDAQFLITGVLGPRSNAHGPNEFLHIATAKNLSACVAQVLTDYRSLRDG